MRLSKYLLILIILAFHSGFSQNTDSLKNLLKGNLNDTTRCNILHALVEAETDDRIWPKYNEELLQLCKKNIGSATPALKKIYLSHISEALNNKGFLAQQQGDMPSAIKFY